MRIFVVTGFESAESWAVNCLRSWQKWLPSDWEIHCCVFNETSLNVVYDDARFSIHPAFPMVEYFNKSCGSEGSERRAVVSGLVRLEWMRWKTGEIKDGYSFRWNAFKFCRMALQTAVFAEKLWLSPAREFEWLVLLDSDVVMR